jgi:hypothetical protein
LSWVDQKVTHYNDTKAFLKAVKVELVTSLGAVPFAGLLKVPADLMWEHSGTQRIETDKILSGNKICSDRQFLFRPTIFVPGNNFCSDRQFLFRPTIFVPTDNFCFDRQILFRPTIFVGRYKFGCLCKMLKLELSDARVRAHMRTYVRTYVRICVLFSLYK